MSTNCLTCFILLRMRKPLEALEFLTISERFLLVLINKNDLNKSMEEKSIVEVESFNN